MLTSLRSMSCLLQRCNVFSSGQSSMMFDRIPPQKYDSSICPSSKRDLIQRLIKKIRNLFPVLSPSNKEQHNNAQVTVNASISAQLQISAPLRPSAPPKAQNL